MAKTAKLHQLAKEHYDRGNLSRAGALCRRILRSDPANAPVLHLFGVILASTGRLDLAAAMIGRSIELGGPVPAFCANLGRVLMQLARPKDAVACFRQALAGDPLNADMAAELGSALAACGRAVDAAAAMEYAADLSPDELDALCRRGSAFLQRGALAEAADAYDRASRIRPYAPAYFNLGVIAIAGNRIAEAQDLFARALDIEPDYPDALNNLALLDYAAGRTAIAEQRYRRALSLGRFHPEAAHNLAKLFYDVGQLDSSVALYRELAARASLTPDSLLGLGNTLFALGEADEALTCYRSAAAARPDWPEAKFNLGLCLLKLGQWAEGWPLHEARLDEYRAEKRHFPAPAWQGDPLGGRTILLHSEQGFGDTFQFCRWAPIVAELGGSVLIECQSAAVPVVSSVEGVAGVWPRGALLPRFDVHASLMSLPALLQTNLTTLPAETPYVFADSERADWWTKMLGRIVDPRRLRVGLVWAGNPEHRNDRNRSLPAECLDTLPVRPEIAYFGLQKDPVKRPDLAAIDLAGYLTDFGETAAAILNLDLIISVDTAIAHLAGAMDRPVWMLLPYASDWRWMTGASDTPWYSSMRLFRQMTRGHWKPVIDNIGMELTRLVGA